MSTLLPSSSLEGEYESRYNFTSREIYSIESSFTDKSKLLPDEEKLDSEASKLEANVPNENDKIIFDELRAYIFQGDWETLLAKLLEYPEFSVNSQNLDDRNFTLLHHASNKKKVECVRILVRDFDADPNIQAEKGYTALHTLVSSDCRCSSCSEKILLCLQILLEDGEALVDSEDDLGMTALYHAARNRLSLPTSFLLSNGANINHWVNGMSVATLLAQYVPDVLKTEFDKRITIHDEKRGVYRGLRLDFRLLLQEPAIHDGFRRIINPSREQERRKTILTPRLRREHDDYCGNTDPNASHIHIPRRSKEGIRTETKLKKHDEQSLGNLGNNEKLSFPTKIPKLYPSASTLSSHEPETPTPPSDNSNNTALPKETELLNYLLKADLPAIEAVVNHPVVEAFVHLKWLSVRKLFFIQRSFYFFLISLYTFYVFDTFVNATCVYNKASPSTILLNKGNIINGIAEVHPKFVQDPSTSPHEAVETVVAGSFLPPTVNFAQASTRADRDFYYFHSFSEYFKAQEMSCESHLRLRTSIMGYLFAAFTLGVVFYELYKMCEGWYDYFKQPLNYCWWILAFSIGLTLTPALTLYAHSWLYPFAAFTIVYGWILLLAQIGRLPYFGIFVHIFVKVVKDFCLLLFTFSPLLLAFALGFSVMLPQNEFFRFIPVAVFKVFLMMTGDVDFWGVFKGTWTNAEHQGHVYIPLFLIYSAYILMVTMVLMSLLLGLAVDNIQEVRREAALHRIVGLIQEIGIFESILHKPSFLYCGCAKFLRRIFSVTSLKCMNGPELIVFPEDPEDETLPPEIKQKLIKYLVSSCCCLDTESDLCHHHHKGKRRGKKGKRNLEKNLRIEFEKGKGNNKQFNSDEENQRTSKEINNARQRRSRFFDDVAKPLQFDLLAKQMETNKQPGTNTLYRDVALYEQVKLLLEDNDKMREKLESLKRSVLKL